MKPVSKLAIQPIFRIFVVLILATLTSHCKVMEQFKNNPQQQTNIQHPYTHYYQKLLAMDKASLQKEIQQQQQNEMANIPSALVKKILLLSLPSSPNYAPFKAKVMLNNLPKQQQHIAFSDIDLSFISLLKIQLDQQLALHLRLEESKRHQDKLKGQTLNLKRKVDELSQKNTKLSSQIQQLKNIEHSISEQ